VCAVGRQLLRVLDLQDPRWQLDAERDVQPRLRVLDLRRDERAGGAVRAEARAGNEGPHARGHSASVDETGRTMSLIEHLPADWRNARLLGRLLTREGPTPVLVSGGRVRDLSRVAPTVAQFLEEWDGEEPAGEDL